MKLRRRTHRHLLLAGSLAFLAVITAAGPASAAPGSGAKVNQEFCSTTPFVVACFDYNYVLKEHTTPSGNTIFTTNGRTTIVQTITTGGSAGCTFTGGGEFHRHYLLKAGETELQESGAREDLSFTRECPGRPTTVCRTILHAHSVEGTFQFYRQEIICPPGS